MIIDPSFEPRKLPNYEFPTRKISNSPLHEAWPHTINPPFEKLQDLVKQGFKISRGKWSTKEDKRLRKNWRRICRCYPEYSDPFVAFGVTHRPPSYPDYPFPIKSRKYCLLKRKYRKFRLLQRMAYKLDHRLMCDIYLRCKKKICYKKFHHQNKSTLPEEVYEKIKAKATGEGGCTKSREYISRKYNVSPLVVDMIIFYHKTRVRERMNWNPEADLILAKCIQRSHKKQNIYQIPTYLIEWAKVAERMKKYDYDVVESQLYQRWIKLNRQMVNVRSKILQNNTT